MNSQIVFAAMIIAMIGAVAVLGMGLVTMVRGKDISGQKTNKLMWWRVYLQGLALIFFALVLYLAKN